MANYTGSLIFIDADVDAYLRLAEDAALNGEVLILRPSVDGVEQISHALQQCPGASEVHILAHGTPGALKLGSASLDLSTLDRYASQVQGWFKAQANLYLYGCNVAAGDAGAEFLAKLQTLTGANIAASTRLVGHASLGGDWQLDTHLGRIVPKALLSDSLVETYHAVLAAPANDSFGSAISLTGANASLTGTNVEATYEAGEPIHDPTVSGLSITNQQDSTDSVWWKWIAPASGPVTVNTTGSNFDTVLSAYTGTAVNSLTQISSNNDANGTTQSSITFTASAGTTYYFAVDGAGLAQGNIKITVDTPASITSNQVFQVSETATAGTTIGTIQANEPNLAWAITSGNLDNDKDGQLAFSINPTTGALTVNDAGDLDYEKYPQLYALGVSAKDASFTSTGTVFVNVTDSADAPVFKSLTPSLTTINEGSKVSLSGVFNDPDQNDQQTVTIVWGDGTQTVIDSDNLTLPDADGNRSFSGILHTYRDNGSFNINVTVKDSSNATSQAKTAVTVNNVAPTITQGDTATLTLNEDSSTTLLLNATDPSSLDVLTWSLSKGAANGTATVSASPTGNNQIITYTPTANFSGTDTFEVQIKDDDGGIDTIAVKVNVVAQPDAPSNLTLAKSAAVLNEGQTLNLTGSFVDPDVGDTFKVTIQWGDGSSPTVLSSTDLLSDGKGTYSFNVNHAYVDDTNGTPVGINVVVQDSTGAIASASTPITVNNLPPTITPGPTTSFSTKEDTAGTLTLNATDPADTSFTWQIASQGTNGTVSLSANPTGGSQVVTYTPNLNFNGIDSFKILVNDGDGGTSIVEVLVGVDPVNDAPQSLTLTPSQTKANEGDTITLSGTFLDVDPSDKHTLTVDWGDGSTSTVNSVNNGKGNYALPANLTHVYKDEGSYTTKVTVTDAGGATVVGTTAVDVANVAPVITIGGAAASSILPLNVPEDKSVTQLLDVTDVGVLDAFTWSVTTQPTNGTVEIVPTGVGNQQQVKYTPNTNASGSDTFVVQVSDGDGGIDTLTYNVTIVDANDPPQILINQFNITENSTTPITADVLYASDIETTDDTQIVFTISNLAAGEQILVGGKAQTTFTRADILNGNVAFVDNGDETPPSFTISVSDGTDTASAPAKVTFTKINDEPVFAQTNTPLKVTEGGSVPVLGSNISATDEESAPLTLVYTISNVIGGQFLRNGTAITQFTLGDLNAGQVFFKHDGSETAPSYTVSVTDGVNTTTRNDVPVFTLINDPPQILNNKFSVTEGADLVISTDVLDATDIETTDDTLLKFTISGLATGDLFKVNGTATTTFTRADILNGNVTFTDNGDEAAPSFTIAVSDGTTTVTKAANVTFTKVNDAPVFGTNTPFTISEGGTTIVRNTNVSATDAESLATSLTFEVKNVVGGAFYRNGSVVTQFTQSEINSSLVSFKHDNSETAPSYTVSVTDGVNTVTRDDVPIFTPVNDLPQILNNQFTITEQGTLVITPDVLDATDIETTDDTLLKFTVSGLAKGDQFQVNGTTTNTFTRADILNGNVTFIDNGDETAPSFTIAVSDGTGTINVPAKVTFNKVNDAPVFGTNTPFTVTEGGTTIVRSTNLSATDAESQASTLTFEVSNVVGGAFYRSGSVVTKFTQAEVSGSQISFKHDNSETAPSYTVAVSDGTATTTRNDTPTFVPANDVPVFLNNSLTIAEGGTVTLTTSDLSANDVETLPNDLQFTVTGIAGGTFLIDGVAQGSTVTFKLEDIVLGRVAFQQNDTETKPTYTVKVTDAGGASATSPATVTFNRANDNPTITANTFNITEGGTVLLSQLNINGADEVGETPRTALAYTVSDVTGGRFARTTAQGTAITSFTQSDIDNRLVVFVHDGTDTTPTYTLKVADTEGGSATSITPNVVLTRVNEPPVLKNNSLTITENGTVLLSQTNLLTIDEESPPDKLTYTISGVTGGQFVLNGTATTTFTQADINNGLVSFVQDGKNAAPTYSVKVTDTVPPAPVTSPSGPFSATGTPTITFTAVNDAPTLVANAFAIQEGKAVTLGSTQLQATDEETTNPAQLVYTVDSVTNGSFKLLAGGAAITTFTQADINAGKVQFVHDGSEAAPAYTVTVKDTGTVGDTAPKTDTKTVDFTGQFQNLNDLPVILANNLAIAEGGLVTLTTANLDASDLETLGNDLSITVSSITGGTFLIDGVAFGGPVQFTLGDVVLQRISFQQDGSNVAPSYAITVADADGGSAGPSVVTVTKFDRVNDNPTILQNTFSITENGRVILNKANIDAIDEVGETARTALKYTVSGVVGGRFETGSAPGVAIASFTQADIDSGKVVFVHDGTNATPTYTLTVTDTEGGTDTKAPTVTFTRVNDAPTLVNNKLTITEDGSVVLGSANLLATDEESDPTQLTYAITGLVGGTFQIGGVATTTFTQDDVNKGLVSFVQDGTNTVPGYTVTVTDTVPPPPVANPVTLSASGKATISFTALNDAPVLTANPFPIDEGKAFILSSNELSAVDEETTDPTKLIYTVDKATSGTFQLVATGATISSFSQADINAKAVQFVHDGSEVAPTFTVTVKDNGSVGDPTPKTATQTVDLTGSFTNLNDLPQLLANSLTISENGTVIFTTDNLNADDLETDQVTLTLNVASVVGGNFQLDGVDVIGDLSFTLADVVTGRVSFKQDGTETKPGYTVSVTDAATTTTPVAANVTFNRVNDNPTILANGFAISEGATVILNNTNISAVDEVGETPAPSLKYSVTGVQGGRFAFATSSGTAITSFTQADLDKSRVVFVHDGSDTTPIYTLTVTDSEGGTDVETAPTVTFTRVNQAPTLVKNQLTVTEGGTVVLSQSDLLTDDEESSPAQLTYTISGLTGGEFRINGTATTTFTQAEVNNGLVSFVHDKSNTAPQYAVTVTDTEPAPPVTNPGTLSATGKATITFNPVNDAPTLTATAFEIQEGAAVVLTQAVLSAVDEETTNPAQLVYTVDKASNGVFQLVATGATVTTFTQDDVNNNRVQFKHDDSEFAPGYTLTVNDAGTPGDTTPKTATQTVTFPVGTGGFVNLNNLPKFTANQLDVQEGTKVVLTSANLSATDDDSINSQLTFRIASVTGGDFYLDGVKIDSTATFTTSAIAFGKLSFQDDGNETAPTYTVEVTDPEGGITTQAATIKLLPVNDNPVLVTNTFTISEDGLLNLSSANLLSKDDETTDPTKLIYTISNLTGGTFALFSGGAPITSFTQAQVTNKEVVFQPDPGTEVAPSFTVTVSDPDGGSATTKANITFNATNDPPALGANSLAISEGGTVVLTTNDLSATDPDTLPANLVFTISGLTGGGEFQVDKDGDGTFETTAATSFSLQDVANGRVRFVDDGDETAPAYSVSVSDGQAPATPAQAAKISFTTANDLPVATDDSGAGFTTNQNTTFTTPSVLANDSDTDPGTVLTITLVEGKAVTAGGAAVALASGALVSLNANGTFTYNPNGKFNALQAGTSKADSFVYTLSDGNGGTDTATVQIVVNGVNDNPIGKDDSGQGFSTNEGTALTTPSLLINDLDVDTGDTFSIAQIDGKAITAGGTVTVTSGAKVTLNANGTLVYDPNGKFETLAAGTSKTDVFAYTLSDSKGGLSTANVSVVVNGLNDVPTAVNDGGLGFSTNEDTAFTTGNVLANDSDIDLGDTLSITQINGAAITVGGSAIVIASGAKVSLNGDGTFTYDPNKAFEILNNGETKTDTFTYTLSDGKGGTSTATVSVAVAGLAGNDNSVLDFEQYSRYQLLDNSRQVVDLPFVQGGVSFDQFFDENYYLSQYSDIAAAVNSGAFQSGYQHFIAVGWREGRNPSTLYNEAYYLSQNPDIAQAVSSGAFSSGFVHFIQSGQREGRNPSALFNQQDYLLKYPDVAAAVSSGAIVSAFEHYVEAGNAEGRLPSLYLYNESYYLQNNPDVAQAVQSGAFKDGFEHFVRFGQKDGRSPSDLFNESSYLNLNSDVQAAVASGAFSSGFEHYMVSGRFEGRQVF